MQMHHVPTVLPVAANVASPVGERSGISPLIAGDSGEEPLTTNAGMPTLKV